MRGHDLLLNPRGEVILSGGSVNSPQLLMLSGIGPAAELARHGIPQLVDAPEVGENLADHLDMTAMASTKGREPIGIAPTFFATCDQGRKMSWGYGVTLHVRDLLPKSWGRVRLASTDPTTSAQIKLNYLRRPDDIGVLLNGNG